MFFFQSGTTIFDPSYARDFINLETQIFPQLSSTKKFYTFKTENMWSSIKSAGYINYSLFDN